jgi:hypothetical protein
LVATFYKGTEKRKHVNPVPGAMELRPTLLALAMLVVVVLAGCAKAAGEANTSSDAPEIIPPSVEVSDSLGGVKGSVVDTSVYPIEGANVSIERASTTGEVLDSATTYLDGGFAFSLLEPGAYRVTATHPNFGAGTALAYVNAGEVTAINVILSDVAGTAPYFLLFLETGFMPCAFSAIAWADACLGDGLVNRFTYNISAGHSYIVVETDWQPRTVTMDHDFWARNQTKEGETPPPYRAVGRGFGQPILRVDFWPEKPYIRALDAATSTPVLFPPSDRNFQFRVDTWYDGSYQAEVNALFGPACAYMLLGYCTGVGLQLDHRFYQYTTVFMNGAPEQVEEYSAVPDQ